MWKFQVDVGGTFTDWIAVDPDSHQLSSGKVLSSSVIRGSRFSRSSVDTFRIPDTQQDPPGFWTGSELRLLDRQGTILYSAAVVDSSDGTIRTTCAGGPDQGAESACATWELQFPQPSPLLAIRRQLGIAPAADLPPVHLCLGTTRGTNALLTRRGARTALVTTQGFGDLLRIGQQDRPQLFALDVRLPAPLYECAVEVEERIAADGAVLVPLAVEPLRQQLQTLRAQGIGSLAVCLLHGFRFDRHERQIGQLARELGFASVSLSCDVAPLIRMVPRGETTVLDAYLNPVIRDYCDSILRALGPAGKLQLMTSAGNLVGRDRFTGKDSVLSGPAGGVVGFARAATAAGFPRAIGFDMGGTSTDVARFDGRFEREYETRKAGIRIVTPVMAIETVAAGGGSICGFDGVRLTVGPDSAGAAPGPACYGAGGPLTVTDLNLLLGRMGDQQFPFRLDRDAARRKLAELTAAVEQATGQSRSEEEIAFGLLEIANQSMALAISSVSVRKGFDPRDHVLVAFGGAGPQHATAVAARLGIGKVLVHPLCSLLSAAGIGQSDRAAHEAEAILAPLTTALAGLPELWERLARRATEQLESETATGDSGSSAITILRQLDLRYAGTEPTIPVAEPENGDWARAFTAAHRQLYGYVQDRPLEAVAGRVEAVIRGSTLAAAHPTPGSSSRSTAAAESPGKAATVVQNQQRQTHRAHLALDEHHAIGAGPAAGRSFWSRDSRGRLSCGEVQHHDWSELLPDQTIAGPALITSSTTTVVVDPGWDVTMLKDRQLLIRQPGADSSTCIPEDAPGSTEVREQDGSRVPPANGPASSAESARDLPAATPAAADPATIEVFNQQFAAIARQMGITLQRTAISVNIRDRLDFSCAVFSAAGELVVNAPHIPVHLGSMGETVRAIIASNPDAVDGDVFVTNHPYRGGSHLPDVTVVTPVFVGSGTTIHNRPDFWVASRGHHAEIGGRTPGSMPPDATTLADEGVLLDNLRVVAAGVDRLECVEQLLRNADWPSRNPADNMADLRAQIAANQMGVRELKRMVAEHSLPMVQQMMQEIRDAARRLVERRLAELPDGLRSFADQLDSGAWIRVSIRKNGGRMRLDFSGTDPVQPDNLNANRGIVAAAAMYVVRCLLDQDIPLNDGILQPVEICLPENCLLHPLPGVDAAHCPAIVGGNVETSQRVVDVLLGALGVAAASQGTMNNWLMGGPGFGYYETLGGGTGATPHGPGASAVHSHMSNTRLTDPEVLETRYPVRLLACSIRRGSGGAGANRGGDGMIRSIGFLQPLTVSLLTGRRVTRPYGMAGGQPGAAGINRLIRADGSTELLPFRTAIEVQPGDRLILETPGGGGWGQP